MAGCGAPGRRARLHAEAALRRVAGVGRAVRGGGRPVRPGGRRGQARVRRAGGAAGGERGGRHGAVRCAEPARRGRPRADRRRRRRGPDHDGWRRAGRRGPRLVAGSGAGGPHAAAPLRRGPGPRPRRGAVRPRPPRLTRARTRAPPRAGRAARPPAPRESVQIGPRM